MFHDRRVDIQFYGGAGQPVEPACAASEEEDESKGFHARPLDGWRLS
jgi:hypothetical protein